MNVLLIIAVALFVAIFIVVLAPIRIQGLFSNADGAVKFNVRITWLIVALEYRSKDEGPVLRVLWFRWGRKKAPEAVPLDTPAKTTPADASTPMQPAATPASPVSSTSAPGPKVDDKQGQHGEPAPRQRGPGIFGRIRGAAGGLRTGWKRLNENRVFFFMRDAAWRGKVLRWGRRSAAAIFGMAQIGRIDLDITAGGDEPDRVGSIYGYVMALYHALSPGKKRRITLRYTPVFLPHEMEITATGSIRTSIARIVAPVMVAAVTFPWISTYLLYARHRKIRKDAGIQAAAGG